LNIEPSPLRFRLRPALRDSAETSQRLASFAAKADELARSRTGDEKRATELAALLEFWLVHGKPRREPKEKD
jgi:hypothetical protein